MPFVETSRGKFYVEDWGGQGPVVCLLHGLTCDHSDWDEIAPRLVEAGFQVLGPDMKGQRPSATRPKAEGYATQRASGTRPKGWQCGAVSCSPQRLKPSGVLRV